jgi:energy-coupling factor transporter transmembrane protein EcfT
MAAYFVYLAVKGLIKKDLWYFVQGSLFLIFAVMLLATILAMALSLSSLSMPRGWSALGRSLVYSVMPALRMMISANLALVLVLTTPSASLSRLLATIIKADWLFIPLTVVLRFLAAFLAQLGLVREALLVRTRRLLILTAICHPAILWRGLIVPMTFQTLKTADQLAISLEMKGLTRKALFWPRPKLFTKSDVGAIVTALIVLAVSITLRSPRVLAFLSQKVSF